MNEATLGFFPLLLALLGLPWLCLALTRSAAEGRVEENGVMGIRTRWTRSSQAAWEAGHAAALPRLKALWPVAGVCTAVVLVFLVLAFDPQTPTEVVVVGPLVGVAGLLAEVGVMLWAAKAANDAAKEVARASGATD